MASPTRSSHREKDVDAQPERLTPLERAIDKSDIDLAACIKALGGLILKAALGIALVIAAATGASLKVPTSIYAVLDRLVDRLAER